MLSYLAWSSSFDSVCSGSTMMQSSTGQTSTQRGLVEGADALGALLGIDNVDVVAGRDGLVRALRLARAAVDALFHDLHRHRNILLMGPAGAQTLRARNLSPAGVIARFVPVWTDWAFRRRSTRLTLYLRAFERAGPGPRRYRVYILYSILLAVGFVLALPWFLWKGRATGKYLRTFRERMGRLPVYLNVDGDRSIWIHAVSVGEVLAARPLVPALRERFPGPPPLPVHHDDDRQRGGDAERSATSTGSSTRPSTCRGPVRQALDVVNPSLLVLVETELWPNLIHEARRRGTRVALVNGRISPRSFRALPARAAASWAGALREVDLFLMQGEAHAERIRAHGRPPRARAGHWQPQVRRRRSRGARPSGWRGCSRAGRLAAPALGGGQHRRRARRSWCSQAFHRVRERVPRRAPAARPAPPRALRRRCRASSRRPASAAVRRSALDPRAWGDGEVLLLDTLGELAQVYSLATRRLRGRQPRAVRAATTSSSRPSPARPSSSGPHMENFQEIADQFRAEGALVQVGSAGRARPARSRRCCSTSRAGARSAQRARDLVERNRGARQPHHGRARGPARVRRLLGDALRRDRRAPRRRRTAAACCRRARLAGPVVSVGNLSVGGSGQDAGRRARRRACCATRASRWPS